MAARARSALIAPESVGHSRFPLFTYRRRPHHSMRVRGEAPGSEAERLMSRRAGNARAGYCDPLPNPGRAERLRSAWKGAGDRDAGWRMDLPGETRRTAAPLWRCADGPACTRRSARVVSDLQDVKKSTGVRGYDMMYRLCHCQPATALTVVMALHRHLFNPALVIVARSPKRCQTPAPAGRPGRPAGGSGRIRPRRVRVSCPPDARRELQADLRLPARDRRSPDRTDACAGPPHRPRSLDEAQRRPDLFAALRVLAGDPAVPCTDWPVTAVADGSYDDVAPPVPMDHR